MKISVVVPVYNTADWMLKQCFDSVLNQIYPISQLIISDDGSTSCKTLEVLRSYKKDASDVVVLLENQHGGISCARNAGIEAATGDFLCFLDSDDFWDENFTQKLVEAQQKTNAEIVYCGYAEVTYKGDAIICRKPSEDIFRDEKKYLYYTCGCGSRMYNVAFLRTIGCKFPDQCIMEDEAFSNLSNTMAKKTAGIAFYGYNVRQRDDSTCRTRRNFNQCTKEQIPFDVFKTCLLLSCDVEKAKRDILQYRLIHAMMASSWVFSCFTDRENKKSL